MPVLNGERHVEEALAGLAGQTYSRPWELLVVDNGCSDRTIAIVEQWRARLPILRVIDGSSGRGINHARNAGVSAARGDFLVFCDADDVASPRWLEEMARAMDQGDLVGGALDSIHLNSPLAFAWCRQPVMTKVPDHWFLPYAPGGNCGVHASVARSLRWDEQFTFGSSDIDFSWRAALHGHRLHFAADAVIHRRLHHDLAGLARQAYMYGRSEPRLYRKWRAHAMPSSSIRSALGTWAWIARHPFDLLVPDRRGKWIRVLARSTGRVVGSIEMRTLFL